MSAWDGWVADVLGGIRAPVNAETARFVNAWGQCEGGGAQYNPLNTTQPEPGATNYNSVGVKNYPDQATGLRATVTTLLNGHYDGIVSDLRAGTFTAAQIVQRDQSEISTWGTRPSCIASQVGASLEPPGTRGPSAPPARRRIITAPTGPSGPTGSDTHLTKAWHVLVGAIGETMGHRAGAADRASRRYKSVVLAPRRRH